MPRALASPLAALALYAFGIEAAVAYVLAGSDGLAELHKTALVAFMIGFPILVLLALLPLAARQARLAAEQAAVAEFHRAGEFSPAE